MNEPSHVCQSIFKKCTDLWELGMNSCPDISNGGNVQQLHFHVLVRPVHEEPLGVHPEGDRETGAGVLRNTLCYLGRSDYNMIRNG